MFKNNYLDRISDDINPPAIIDTVIGVITRIDDDQSFTTSLSVNIPTTNFFISNGTGTVCYTTFRSQQLGVFLGDVIFVRNSIYGDFNDRFHISKPNITTSVEINPICDTARCLREWYYLKLCGSDSNLYYYNIGSKEYSRRNEKLLQNYSHVIRLPKYYK